MCQLDLPSLGRRAETSRLKRQKQKRQNISPEGRKLERQKYHKAEKKYPYFNQYSW